MAQRLARRRYPHPREYDSDKRAERVDERIGELVTVRVADDLNRLLCEAERDDPDCNRPRRRARKATAPGEREHEEGAEVRGPVPGADEAAPGGGRQTRPQQGGAKHERGTEKRGLAPQGCTGSGVCVVTGAALTGVIVTGAAAGVEVWVGAEAGAGAASGTAAGACA